MSTFYLNRLSNKTSARVLALADRVGTLVDQGKLSAASKTQTAEWGLPEVGLVFNEVAGLSTTLIRGNQTPPVLELNKQFGTPWSTVATLWVESLSEIFSALTSAAVGQSVQEADTIVQLPTPPAPPPPPEVEFKLMWGGSGNPPSHRWQSVSVLGAGEPGGHPPLAADGPNIPLRQPSSLPARPGIETWLDLNPASMATGALAAYTLQLPAALAEWLTIISPAAAFERALSVVGSGNSGFCLVDAGYDSERARVEPATQWIPVGANWSADYATASTNAGNIVNSAGWYELNGIDSGRMIQMDFQRFFHLTTAAVRAALPLASVLVTVDGPMGGDLWSAPDVVVPWQNSVANAPVGAGLAVRFMWDGEYTVAWDHRAQYGYFFNQMPALVAGSTLAPWNKKVYLLVETTRNILSTASPMPGISAIESAALVDLLFQNDAGAARNIRLSFAGVIVRGPSASTVGAAIEAALLQAGVFTA